MRVAQGEDAEKAGGRDDHVQRYTAFAGQAFEAYCLRIAKDYVPPPAIVLGEQGYGKAAGNKTSDVAVAIGDDPNPLRSQCPQGFRRPARHGRPARRHA